MTVTRTHPDRTCERCGNLYTPTSSRQKICPECWERPQVRPYIPYEIPLGDRERARLVLPADLTQAEADRICGVIQTLPFPDPAERHPDDPDKPAEQGVGENHDRDHHA